MTTNPARCTVNGGEMKLRFALIGLLLAIAGCDGPPMTQERLDMIRKEFANCMELSNVGDDDTVRACDSIAWSREHWQTYVNNEQEAK
jgi:hypothetical protein